MTPEEEEIPKWYEMSQIDKAGKSAIFTASQKNSIAKLEEQLHQRNFPSACLKFSGHPGFSDSEKVILRHAMVELINNSARTVLACKLANRPSSDCHEEITRYFICKADDIEGFQTMAAVNKLHKLVTNTTQIIEFIDNRTTYEVYWNKDNKKREKLRAKYYPQRGFYRDINFAKRQGSLKANGYNEEEWDNILAEDSDYHEHYHNCCHRLDYNTLEFQAAPVTLGIPISVKPELLHFAKSAPQRALIIYQSLAKALPDNETYAPSLYNYTLEQYEGKITPKQESKKTTVKEVDRYANYSNETDDGL